MDATNTVDLTGPPNKKIKKNDQDTNPKRTASTTAENFSTQIDLLPAEQLLRKLLLDCRDRIFETQNTAQHENDNDKNDETSSSQHSEKCVIWFVGGWVRDKLLSKQSSDIDVALSTMTGPEFATHLKQMITEHADNYKEEAVQMGVSREIRGFHQIDRNPGKGKHLDTTSAQIFGLDIDFVQLRNESTINGQQNEERDRKEWSKDQPSISSLVFDSAPEEDACRRDATINAIFYNLETQQVEDYTKTGLQDIQARVLRTPLDAYMTFGDDPLRILRLIRLACTLDFKISDGREKTEQAMMDPDMQSALSTRTSRERIGAELKKILNSSNPERGLYQIRELQLYPTVFLDFQDQDEEDFWEVSDQLKTLHSDDADCGYRWPAKWSHAYGTLVDLLNGKGNEHQLADLVKSEDHEMVWQMAVWSPLVQLRICSDLKIDSVIVKAATKAINATSKKSRLLADSFKNMDSIRSTVEIVKNAAASNENELSPQRSTIGMAIRAWGITWKLQVLYSLLAEIAAAGTPESEKADILERYSVFLEFVSRHKLQEAPTIRPILNGGDIKAIFGLKKTGPFMKDVTEALLSWQLDHEGDGTDREGGKDNLKMEVTDWLRGQKEILGIPDPE